MVRLDLSRAQVAGMRRVGNDLVVTTTAGETLTVHGFFTAAGQPANDLVLNGEGGEWLVSLGDVQGAQGELAAGYTSIDSVEPLLLHQGVDLGALPWVVGGGLAAAAIASGGGGGDDGPGIAPFPPLPPVPPVPPPTGPVDTTPPGQPTVRPTSGGTITGTAEPGAVVTVTDGSGRVIGSATAAADGSYAITPTTPPPDGTVLQVVATDPAGNASPPATVTVDSTPPALPTVNLTDGSPITGTAEAGSVVTVTDSNGHVVGSATVGANGTYSITPATTPADGTVLHVTATDAAGNTSPAATVTVDSTPPAAPVLNPTDGSPITGTAEPGAVVTLTTAGGTVIGSVTAGPDGSFSFTPATPPVQGTVIVAVATDPTGNVGAPASATIDGMSPTPTVNPTDGSPITGTAEPGAMVTVTDSGGTVIGSATVAPNGTYSVTPATVPPNGAVLSVVATDAGGNPSQPATVTVDSVAPPVPTVALTDGSPITGTGEPGAVVKVSDGSGNLVGSATVAPDGTYSITPATPPPNGTVLHVTATDAAGNVSPEATVTVDSVAPLAPTVKPTDGSPITGTAEPGAVVTVTDGAGTVIGSATVAPGGTYSITPATVPPNGTVLHVTATDPTGNVSPEATATVDSVAPAAPTVNATDGSPITGTAEPGAVVTVTDGGGTVIGSATVAPNGAYSLTPSAPPPNGTVLHVTATDAAGNTGPEATTTVDSVAPGTPTVNPTDGSPITGTAEPGATVTVTDNGGTVIGSATVAPNGSYSITPATVPPNGTVLHVTATDAAGNASAGATATVDSVAPAAPTVNPTDGSPITGTAEPGALVTVTDGGGAVIGSATAGPGGAYSITPATVPPNGTVLNATATDAAGNTSAPGTATVDSVAPVIAVAIVNDANNDGFINAAEKGPNVTVKVSLVSGAAVGDVIDIASTTNGITTTTSVTLGAADVANGFVNVAFANPPEGGTLSVSATSRDLAGNVSAPATDSATVDTSLAAPGLTVGPITPDNVVNAAEAGTTVTVSGTATGTQAGNVVTLVVNGVSYSGTVDAGGHWNIAVAGSDLVADADHTVAASVVTSDAAGNTATGTASQPYGVSTAAPVVAIAEPVAGDDRVNAAEDHALVVSGTTVNVENGQTVTVTFSDGVHSVTATAIVAGNAWTATAADISGLTNGPVTIRVDVQDLALNPATDTHTVTLDNVAPTQTAAIATYADNVGADQGNLVGGTVTDDTTPVLNGTLSAALGAGDTVRIYDGGTLVGTATVTGTAWTFATPTLTNGSTHTYTAVVVDAAGNPGTASAGFTLTVDTTAPTQSVSLTGYTDNTGTVQGDFGTGTRTDDTTPTLNGTLSAPLGAGDVVRIYDGATLVGTATVNGTGWTFTPTALADGTTHTYTAVVADAAGNQGTPSGGLTLTVDTTAPTQTASIGGYIDDVGVLQATLGSGTTTDDTTPTLTGTLSAALGAGDVVRIYDGATLVGTATVNGTGWTFTPTALADGTTHTYTAVVADAAGNESTASAGLVLTVDTTAPTQTASIGGYIDDVGTLQATFGSGTTTDDTTPTLTGTLSAPLGAGDTVRLYDGATFVGTATVTGTGWTFAPGALADGTTHTYTAVVTDAAGNLGTPSTGLVLTVDTTAPAQTASIAGYTDNVGSVQGEFGGGTTDDPTPVLHGTLSAPIGATDVVRIYDGATLVGTATVTGTTWSFAPAALAEGVPHTYTAVVADAAGNESAASPGLTLTLDTVAPAQTTAIVTYTDNAGTDQGPFGSGTTTDDTTPVLNGTLSAVLNAGDTVRIYEGTTLLGTATVSGTGWTFTTPGLLDGSTHTYTAVVADAAGNQGTPSTGFTLSVETTGPSQLAAVVSYTDDTGTNQGPFGGGVPTDDATPVLNGTLSAALGAGEFVRIYDGATLIGTATVTGTGWAFALPPLTGGTTHSYTAVVTDAAGNESTPSPAFALAVDTTAPAQTTAIAGYTDDTGANQGSFGTGVPTDDTTPVLDGTLSGALGAGDVVRIYEGTTLVGTATVSGTTWTFATPVLASGSTHTYTAVVADAAGNEGAPSAGFTLTVDTTPPAQTAAIGSVTDDVGTQQGSLASGSTTDDTTPTLGGTLSAALGAGDTVRIYDGATFIGTATVAGTAWSFTPAALPDGSSHSFTAVVADAAGNLGTASAPFTLTVDASAPAQTAAISGYADNVGTVQATFGSGTTTDDTTPTLNGTLSAALAAGDVVRIYDGATLVGTATVNGASWSFTPGALADGTTHSYTAVVADAAGNQGTASPAFTLTVDTTPPAQTATVSGYIDNVGTLQGSYGSGTSTDDTTPTLTGTLSAPLAAGDTVRIYDGATLVGTATVTGASWSFTPSALAGGSTHSYTAVVADAAGNQSAASTPLVLTIDTTAPTLTAGIVSYTDNIGANQDTYPAGTPTDDTAPVLNGTLSAALGAGDTVRIYDGGTLIGTATVTGTSWTFATPALANGSTHSYTAVVADAAGNEGTPSGGFALTVDTSPPAQGATIATYADNAGGTTGNFGSGVPTDDTTPVLNGTLSAPLGAGDAVRIYEGATLVGTATVTGNTWSFATPTLADGSIHTYTAVVADAAGNLGTSSAGFTVVVDTTPPAQTALIASYTDNVGTNQGDFGGGVPTDDITPVLNGTLSGPIGASDTVRIYDGATLLGTATVTGSSWTFAVPALADGSTHSYTAVVADAAGNPGTASPAFTLGVDLTPPTQAAAIASYTDNVGVVQGQPVSGSVTDDTTPVLNGTLSAALGTGDTVRIYEGGVLLGTATVTGTTWTFATPVLADGSTHTYTAAVADAAGNEGAASAGLTLTVDTTPPAQTASFTGYTDNVGTQQGTFPAGTPTDDTTPVLNGMLSAPLAAGDTVRIYDGGVFVGTATVSGTMWSFATPTLADGSTHSYTAVVADAAGNLGTVSPALALAVDTTPPVQTTAIASYTDNAGTNQADFGSGVPTDDTTPMLNGTLNAALGAGDVVRIYDGATLVGTATVNGTGWTFATPTLADGSTHSYTAVVADAAGNEGTPSAVFTLAVDTTPPAQTASLAGYIDNVGVLQATFGSGTTTDDTTPTLTGTLSAALGTGDTVRIYDGATQVGTATVNGTAWSFTPGTLANGSTHSYTAVVADAAGNQGTASAGLVLTVDTTPPAQTAGFTGYTDNAGTVQGSFGSGVPTDDTTPVLNGTLSAPLAAGDTVRIYDGAVFVGTATVTGTAWSFATPVLTDGTSHTYTAVVADAAGNLGTASAGLVLAVDTTPPAQTTVIATYTDNVGTNQDDFGSGTPTDDTTPVLNGTLGAALGAGDTVRIYDGATLVGTATVSGTGWTFAPPALANGSTHSYTAVVADAAGNEGTPSAAFTLTVDTTPPTQTASLDGYIDDVGTLQATFGTGTRTDDTTPTLTGTLSAALGAGDVVRIYDGATLVGTASVTGSSWSFTPTALANGSTHTYTVVVADAAGNQGTPSTGLVLTVDTTPPAQTASLAGYTDNVGTLQGSYGTGSSTDDTTPTLNGTLSAALGAGDTVRIYDGATLVGTATVNGTAWSFTPGALANGSTHTYTAVVADAAGNESAPSTGLVLTVDTTAPTQTASLAGYIDNVGTLQATFGNGSVTDDTTPTLTGTLSAALGAGDTVRLYDGGVLIGTATVTGTSWTFTTPVLADGSTHTYTAVVADAAGNEGAPSAGLGFTIDTTAPTQAATIGGYTDNVGTLQGSFGSGTTDDPTPVLTGTLSAGLGAGDTVRIYDGATLLGTATVTGNTWSFAPAALTEGVPHTYTAVVADAAGNEGPVSPGLALTLDTVAPAQTAAIVSYSDNAGGQTGDFGSGTETDDTTPVLNGTLNAALGVGDTVRIYDGGVLIGTATVNGSAWTFATPGLLDGSSHTYTAVVADAAGNEGTLSTGFTLNVVTTGPSQLATVVSYTDDTGTNQGPFGSGVPTDDTTPVLNGTLSAGLGAGEFVRIYDGATLIGTATVSGTGWTFALPPLTGGTIHSYTAVVTDAAGNESTPSPAFALAVDTTAPAQTTAIAGYTDDTGTLQGPFGSGTTTDDTTPVLNGTLSAPLGAGDIVRIYEGTTLLGTATVSGTTWSFAGLVLASGSTHTYTAVVTDAAGNESAASPGFTLTIDTTAPAQTAAIGGYTDDVGTLQGSLLGSGTTDDTTPTLTGTLSAPLAAGDTVRIYDGATLVGTATVTGTGWNFTPPALADGSVHSYTAVVADAAGNEATASAPLVLTIDTTPPAQTATVGGYTDNAGTVQGSITASGTTTDDTTPTLTGTLSAAIGATDVVRIYDGATLVGTATVTGTAWSFTPGALADGSSHSYTVVVADAAGNESAPSPAFTLTIDTTAPAQTATIGGYTDNVGSLQGSYGSGTSTDDTTPTLNGTLSAAIGATDVVRIYDGATFVGTATVTGTGWTFTPTALADGTTHSYTAVVADAAGNESTASPALTLTVDTTAPLQTAAIGGYTDNVGTVQGSVVASGTSTDDTTPTLNGTLSAALGAGDVVRIYDGATLVGTATVTGTSWSFTPGALANGSSHSYTAVVADAAGNESTASTAFTLTVDTTPPMQTAAIGGYIDNVGSLQGTYGSGTSTDDTTPTLTGTLSAAIGATDVVRIYDGATLVGTATVTGTGWTFTPTALADGSTHSYTAVVADAAGNESAASPALTLTVDTTAPLQTAAIGGYTDNVGTVQGGIATSGTTTDDTTPTLTGTLSAAIGATDVVRIYDGATLVGTATVTGTAWSFTPPVLADGTTHSYTAVVADAAGNESAPSAAFALTIDTTAPAQTAAIGGYTDDVGILQATFGSGTSTDDTTPTLTGTLSAAIGATDTVRIYDGATFVGTATVTGTTWRFASAALPDGSTHSFTAVVADAAGNLGTASPAFTLTVDTTPPAQTAVVASFTDDAGIVLGNFGSGSTTDDTTPVLNGTLSATLAAGDTVRIYDGATFLGTATVSGTGWTFAPTALADGSTHSFTAVVTDAAGNLGTASPAFTLTVDTTPPAQTAAIASFTDNVGTNQGPFGSGVATDDTTPVLNGTLSAALGAGDTVRLYDGATFIGTATVTGTTWTFAPSALAGGSSHSYTAVVTDAAGNLGTASAPFTLTVDITVPAQTAAIASYTDNVGTNQSNYGSGTSTDDTTPVLNGSLSAAIGATDTVRIYDGGTLVGTATVTGTTWTFATPVLLNGSTHTYTAVVADAAGNESAASAPLALTVDTTPPAQGVAVTAYLDNAGVNQGSYGNGSTTDDTTPVLTGTLSAALGAGDTVRIYEGATLVGTATVTGTTWSFATPVLADGSTHTYTAVVADAAGNQGTASAGFSLTVDTAPPAQTVFIVNFTDNVGINVGNLGSGVPTDDTTPVLNGTLSATLAAGDTVRLYDGATFVGTATVTGTAWTFATPVLADGSIHTYTAVVADAAGNLGTASAGFTLAVDTTPPAQTALIVSFADDVGLNLGNFGSGVPTDDTTPVLNGTLSAALGAGDTVRLYDGAVFIGNATVTGTTWTFATPALLNGSTHVYTAVVADAAGNQAAASAGFTLTVDTTAPTAAIDIVSIADDTGSSAIDFLTRDTSLTVNGTVGTLGAGEKAQISIDGSTWVDLAVVGGAWSFVDARVLTGGSYTYRVRVVDAAGNLGATDTQAVVVDVTAPTQVASVTNFIDNLGPLTGTLLSGAITDDTTPVLNGSITAGVSAGDILRIYQDGVLVQSVVLVAGQTSWSYAPAALGFGLHSYVVTLADAAGNETVAGVPFTLTVDALATLNTLATDTGVAVAGGFSNSTTTLNTDLVTRDSTPVLNGTIGRALQADEVVRISLDGGLTWTTVQDVDGATAWTYAPPAYATTTTVAAQVRVENTANGSHGTASAVSFTVDLAAPVLTLTAPGLANAATIDPDGDRTIAAGTATFSSAVSGTAEVGTTVALINDVNHDGVYTEGVDVVLGTALVGAGGAWSLSAALSAGVGAYHLGYVVWDAAGNQSRLSTTAQVDVVPVLDHLSAAASAHGTSSTSGFGGGMAVNLQGNWSFVGDQAVYNGTSRTAYVTTDLGQQLLSGGTSTAYSFFDYNLDGILDVIGTDNNAGGVNSTPLWTGLLGLGYTPGAIGTGLSGVSNGGVAVIDMDGDGYLDAIVGDGAADSASFLKNTAGVFTAYGNSTGLGLTASGIASLQTGREVSGVDLNNDGRVDIALHSTTTTTLGNNNDFTLTLLTNNGKASLNGANWTESQAINDVFATNAATGNATDAVSLTWADFNNDGWLDLYVNSSKAGTASKVYLNNAGTLSTTGVTVANDTLAGDASVAVDWNGDGRMDAVELDYATGVANLYTNSGNVAAGGWATRQLAGLTPGTVNSLAAADYDWDGDIDLLVGVNAGAATQIVTNTNQVKDGTSLHLRILNAEGFNVYFGNTVQVFDAAGTLVATQILNGQSGSWSNDSSGIVNVFGLDPAQTYTVKLLANNNGASATYSWSVAPGDATSAQLLTTTDVPTLLPNVMTGTGYDDTYVVGNVLGGSTVYNGGGGWSTPLLPGETKTWSATGGMDIVDFRNAVAGVGVDLTTNLVTGWGILGTVNNVEGVRGSALADTFVGSLGDNLFEGRGGNDTYVLSALGVNAGNDRLVYNLLNAADKATGGNGSDVANGFVLGSMANAASTDADLIDLGGLLAGYTGTAHVYRDADTGNYVLDPSSAGLLNYLHVTNVGGNTVISVDLGGTGNFSTPLLTLTGVTASLETLLGNGQLLLGGGSGTGVQSLAAAQDQALDVVAEKTVTADTAHTAHTVDPVASGHAVELAANGQQGHETLLYKLLTTASATGATGGNGFDEVNGFHVGAFESNADADRIDLSALLTDYAAHAGDPLSSYLQLTASNGNTVLSIDRDGAGGAQAMTPLLSLNGVSIDLATLLANHQLVVV